MAAVLEAGVMNFGGAPFGPAAPKLAARARSFRGADRGGQRGRGAPGSRRCECLSFARPGTRLLPRPAMPGAVIDHGSATFGQRRHNILWRCAASRRGRPAKFIRQPDKFIKTADKNNKFNKIATAHCETSPAPHGSVESGR